MPLSEGSGRRRDAGVQSLKKRRARVLGCVGGGGTGFMEREMAWMPWKVPARMSASLEVRFWRPGEKVRLYTYRAKTSN